MNNICPYPGLRPFTEEESIYFKGRDTHILQIISQLEQKKFLMLTGASGDGKSSLVYAGVIPNARAGFFKAKFNNWVVADFRPERNPLQQLSNTISKCLSPTLSTKKGESITNAQTEKELSYGFSSLINLYKSSKHFVDTESEAFKNADEKEKKSLKRKGANLLILADQFEEFFTNPENYSKGVPSKESQIVVNLLIETAKIALEQNLPIYIICTMRSDYIGQCATFRGLPEMIGFSQFFVPRLKRKEIHQVIEAPALLSGNKISNRLIETLINEMSEGFDQLPILQHTLNALWEIADGGNEEMDLVHLAMIAGINSTVLPQKEKQKFDSWFSSRPEFYKDCYCDFSLERSLSANADILFEIAHEYYNKTGRWKIENQESLKEGNQISKETAQLIISTTFKCLTKIDEGRAVRNRMTLQEITEILNQEDLTVVIVGGVLNIFRAQGATFISPFITDNLETHNLKPATVLDITHESFIRNWGRLKDWAKEEYENLLTFQDFNKQLQRWITNKKSSGYLLPIGPLTYFENWLNTAKPNKYWFARYDESEITKEEKLIKAEQLLKDAEQFIKRSARKLFFSRTVLRYGAVKLFSIIGTVVLIALCSYYYEDYRSKQNTQVIEMLEERGIELLTSKKVTDNNKADFIINYERLHNHSFEKVLNNINNDASAFDIALTTFIKVDNFYRADSGNLNPMAYPLLTYMGGRIENLINQQLANKKQVDDKNLERLNKLVRTCVKIKTLYHKDTLAKKYISKYEWVLNNAINSRIDVPIDSIVLSSYHLNQSIQLVTLLNDEKLIDINKLINKISPYENEDSKKRFAKLFPKEVISKQDVKDANLNYNGGFHLMALLYASKGEYEKITTCLDSLHSDYAGWNGLYDIFCFLITNKHFSINESSKLIEHIFKKSQTKNNYETFFKTLVDYTYSTKILTNDIDIQNYVPSNLGWSKDEIKNVVSLAPYLIPKLEMYNIIDNYWSIQKNKIKTSDEQNYWEAMYYKLKGNYAGEIMNDNKLSISCFENAYKSYDRITNKKYLLDDKIDWYLSGYSTQTSQRRYFFFNSSILMTNFISEDELKNYSFSILNYNIKNDSFKYDNLCANEEFLRNYFSKLKIETNESKQHYDYSYFEYARMLNKNNPSGEEIVNKEFLDLVFINKAFEEDDTAKAYNIIERLDKKKIFLATFSDSKSNRYLIKQVAENLALNNKYKESMEIINAMEGKLKRNILIDVVEALQSSGPIENSLLYLDEFFKSSHELQKETDSHYGLKIYKDIAMIGTKPMYDLGEENIKDVVSAMKPRALINFIRGIIHNENYYLATQYIPDDVSSNRELQLYNEIIMHYVHSKIFNTVEDVRTHKLFKVLNDKDKGWEERDNNFEKSSGADYEMISGDDISFDSLD